RHTRCLSDWSSDVCSSDLPEGHVALGMYLYHGLLNYEAALRELEIARQLRPSDSEVYATMDLVQRRQGKWQEAYDNQKKAVDLEIGRASCRERVERERVGG